MFKFSNFFSVVKFGILLLLIPLSDNLLSQENTKVKKPGVAVYVGIGSLFGGGGLMVEYQIPFPRKYKINPFISVGSQAISTDLRGSWFGYTSGINLEFGKIDFDKGAILNWLLGFNYGSQGVGFDKLFLKGSDIEFTQIHQHLLMGFASTAGYKFVNRFGFTWQVYMGMCYVHNPIAYNTNYFFRPTGGAGIGYKF
jgi:hypothetical protein